MDGKPFKTREGGVMKLEDLISMGIEKARERLKEAGLGDDIDNLFFGSSTFQVGRLKFKFPPIK